MTTRTERQIWRGEGVSSPCRSRRQIAGDGRPRRARDGDVLCGDPNGRRRFGLPGLLACRSRTEVWVAEVPSGTVTFLFTVLEGSTRLWEEHPEAMRPALARHDEILREAVAARGGHVVKTTGDGMHAV